MQELIDYTGASFMSLKILSHCFVSNIIEIHFAKHLFTPLLTYDNQLIYILYFFDSNTRLSQLNIERFFREVW